MAKKDVVFIVEDNPTWAATLKARLTKKFNVMTFASGEEAIKNLKAKPKIVILDYHLEGNMTGADVLKVIKEKLPDTYVIILSAQKDIKTALEILKSGAYDYIIKGETAINRLRIILKKIAREEEAKAKVFELKLKLNKVMWILGAFITIAIIGIGLFFVLMK